MAKTKKHRSPKNGANGIPFRAKLTRDRLIRESIQKATNDAAVQIAADTQTQRALWLSVASIADAYGIGEERIKLYFAALQANTEEYERMRDEIDEDYANEKLRLKAERVTGTHIEYLYEAEMRAAQEKHEREGVMLE